MAETGTGDTRPKLLIVDDDHELCSMLVEYLGPKALPPRRSARARWRWTGSSAVRWT